MKKNDELTRRFTRLAIEMQQMVVDVHLAGIAGEDTKGTATAIVFSIFRANDPKIIIGMKAADQTLYCRVHKNDAAQMKEAIKERVIEIMESF